MRSPGVIYRRYRQLRRRILYQKMQDAQQKKYENCFYAKALVCSDDHGRRAGVKLCVFGLTQENRSIDVCTCAKDCNAFAYRRNRNDVLRQFEEETNNPRQKRQLYPELATMDWVLDKTLTEAIRNPSILGRFIVTLIRFLEGLLKRVSGSEKNLMKST